MIVMGSLNDSESGDTKGGKEEKEEEKEKERKH